MHYFSVLVDPETPSIINGGVMGLTGRSFNTDNTHDDVTCTFTDDDGDVTTVLPRCFECPIKGIIVNCKAICPMPLFRKLGPHNLTVTVNDNSYVGGFVVGKIVLIICVVLYCIIVFTEQLTLFTHSYNEQTNTFVFG